MHLRNRVGELEQRDWSRYWGPVERLRSDDRQILITAYAYLYRCAIVMWWFHSMITYRKDQTCNYNYKRRSTLATFGLSPLPCAMITTAACRSSTSGPPILLITLIVERWNWGTMGPSHWGLMGLNEVCLISGAFVFAQREQCKHAPFSYECCLAYRINLTSHSCCLKSVSSPNGPILLCSNNPNCV